MNKFLKLGMVLGLFLTLSMASYEASAKVKLKTQESTVLHVDDYSFVVLTSFREAVTNQSIQGAMYSEGFNLSRVDHPAVLCNTMVPWENKPVYGGRYLHRSQAWLKFNNLQINSRVNTFGRSTEIGSVPMLC